MLPTPLGPPVAPALACWPARAASSPEWFLPRPPPGSHRRALLPTRSPSQPTVSALSLGPREATCATCSLGPRSSSARGRATTGPPPPLADDISGQSTATHRSRVSPIANPPHLFATPCLTSPSESSSSPPGANVKNRGYVCEEFKLSRDQFA
jgi:hypothetical protein